MKKFKSFYMVAALMIAAVAFGFNSCSDDDDVEGGGSKSDLIGTWQSEYYKAIYRVDGKVAEEYDDYDSNTKVQFNSDGTYVEYYNGYKNEEGKWSYKNGKITTTYYDEGEKISDKVSVKTLTNTKLIIEGSYKETNDGVTYEEYYYEEYRKVDE